MNALKALNFRIEEVAGHMPDPVRWELVDGELHVMAPSNPENGELSLVLGIMIGAHVRKHRLGKAYAAETGFALGREPDTLLAPDVAFVKAGRAIRKVAGFFDGPPDLAVEVISPSDSRRKVLDKTRRWLDHGTQEVWNVWPKARSITIHGRGARTITLNEDDTLDGGELLPGFTCRVGEVFE